MKKRIVFLSVSFILVMLLTFSTVGQSQGPSDSRPSGNPEVVIPEMYRPSAEDIDAAAAASTTLVYFTPMDEDTSTTCLFLYNTSMVTATVSLRTYQLNGALNINTNIIIPANNLVRICGDPVSTYSYTWQNVVLVNFTSGSTYGSMSLPTGVKVDGYVVWNGNTGTYDPLQIAPTLPLRLSTDPLTMFLPMAPNGQ